MIKLNDKTILYDKKEYKKNIDKDTLYIDFKNNPSYTLIKLKKFKKIKKVFKKIVIANYQDEVIDFFKTYYIKDRKKQIEFIYDTVCDMLDKKWAEYSPCEFCDNRCISSRNNFMDREFDGCCHSFERKLTKCINKQPCRYLGEDKRCTTKNLSCKLFTCDYLKKSGKFDTNYEDFLLLKMFFTKKEKLVIKYNFFKKREEVIEKLLEKNRAPYLLYLIKLEYMI